MANPARVPAVLIKALMLVGLYILTGNLALSLVADGSYPSFVWPPAGIALGMLLLYGWRLWPAVLAGAFLLHGYGSEGWPDSVWISPRQSLAALGLAIAATCQALTGFVLVRKLFGLPVKLDRGADILLLAVVCGPLACLPGVVLGKLTLMLAADAAGPAVAGNWALWWLGEILGVLFFLPFALLAPGDGNRVHWRGNASRGLPAMATVVVFMPLVLTFFAWKMTSGIVENRNADRFEALARDNEKALLNRMNSYNQALISATAYHANSAAMNQELWRHYVQGLDIATNLPGINGLGVITKSAKGQLQALQIQMHKEGTPDFDIHPDTENLPFYIISRIEPLAINREALGLNIAFETHRREAADLARDTGEPAITQKIILVQDAQQTPGFLLLHPFYDATQPRKTLAERRAAISGWVYAPFIGKNFLANLTPGQGAVFDLEVYDGGIAAPENLIYSSSADSRTGDAAYTLHSRLDVMQQDWLVVWRSTPVFENLQLSNEPTMVLVGGLTFSALLGVMMLILTIRRTRTMEWMLGDRNLMMPFLLFSTVAIGSVWLYHTLSERERSLARIAIGKELDKVAILIRSSSHNQFSALQRMARRWESAGGTPMTEWQVDAANYVRQFPALTAVEWIDGNHRIQWVEPLAGNEMVVGFNVGFDAERRAALALAETDRNVTVTPPIELVQGYPGFVAYSPLVVDGTFDGFIAAVFDIKKFFQAVINEDTASHLQIELVYEGAEHFRQSPASRLLDREFAMQQALMIGDKEWQIKVTPTDAFARARQSALPEIVLLAGLLIGTLLALTLRAILIARIKSAYLVQSNDLNTNILASATYPIIAVDRNGLVMLFNRAAEEVLGYRAAELLGTPMPRLWHDREEIEQRAAELSEHLGKPVNPGPDVFITRPRLDGRESREWTFRRKDGSSLPVNLTVTPLRASESGETTGFLGVIEDITERKAQQIALKASEEKFRAAMEYAPIGMALVDPEGNFLRVNPALCRLLGYEPAELTTLDFQSITHPDDKQTGQKFYRDTLAGKRTGYRTEKRYLHKSGRIIWALLKVSLVRDHAGEPRYFIGQIVDITEQKEMERMKSEFVSIVSHELRTPLTSIRGALGLIAGTMAGELPGKANHLINIAHQSCERLILLINDILDMDKITSGQMRLAIRKQFLAPIIHKAVEDIGAYGDKYEVAISARQIDPSLLLEIDGDRLIQVLNNLLSNAVKFSEPGSEVTVIAGRHGDRARIAVADSGCGISEEFKPRIFERFSQADSSATRVRGGTGLGLHISKQIVEQMNGAIGFDTKTGQGTTFWMEFPLAEAPVGLAGEQTEAPVLVCESDPAVADAVKAILEGAGFRAESARTAEHARELLDTRRYAAITLSLDLPEGGGIKFVHDLRQRARTAGIPVVVTSTSMDSGSGRLQGSAAGICNWLTKPVDSTNLIASLKSVVGDPGSRPRILHVEDDRELFNLLAASLEGKVELESAESLAAADRLLSAHRYSLVILDIELPDGSGLSLLPRLTRDNGALVPVLILSASECPEQVRSQVAASFVKARMSEQQIVDAILELARGHGNTEEVTA